MKILKSVLVAVSAADLFDIEQCPENGMIACTRDYKPVCGNDGKTYGNPCMARYVFCSGKGELTGIAGKGTCEQMQNDPMVNDHEEEEGEEPEESEGNGKASTGHRYRAGRIPQYTEVLNFLELFTLIF